MCGSFPKILVHVIHFGELEVLCKINHSISYNLPKKMVMIPKKLSLTWATIASITVTKSFLWNTKYKICGKFSRVNFV